MNRLSLELCTNQTCPWSGDPVSEDSLTVFNGQVVGFCNPGCRDKFEKAIQHFEAAENGRRVSLTDVATQIFSLSTSICYVAQLRNGQLHQKQRDNLHSASSSETDKYEELFVNPALMTLVRQRGEIDCGGASFVVVGYGNFKQLIIALTDGHVSVAFEHATEPIDFVEAIKLICKPANSR